MSEDDRETDSLTPLQREAQAWIRRLTSGEAVEADAAAFKRWCSLSPVHAAALFEASQFWDALGAAGRSLCDDEKVARRPATGPAGKISRRVVISGALAASAAGVMIMRPPLGLWPSLSELRADYRTKTGEQREINVADGVSVQMNSQTSLSVSAGGELPAIELIAGQASFKMPKASASRFTVIAGGGRASATEGGFDVRLTAAGACVTCLSSEVEVQYQGRTLALEPRQQLSYGEEQVADVVVVDPAVVSAWQRGLIICNMMPLADVVEELNRYRGGRIVLLNDELGRSPVNGRFRIDQPDEALAQIERAFGVHRRVLPGGLVLLT